MPASTKTAWLKPLLSGAWQGIAMNTIIYISTDSKRKRFMKHQWWMVREDGVLKITFPLIIPFFTINLVFMYEKCDDGI